MPRDIPIGNGSLLLAFDSNYRIADLYFPRVGMENHAAGRFRFGVWADGELTWVEDAKWSKSLGYLRDTLVTDVTLSNEEAGLRLRCYDGVDSESNVFLRKIVVRNLRAERRQVKIFLHHDLSLYGNAIGDTALYDPDTRGILHYKAKRYLLANAAVGGNVGVVEYACGRGGIGSTEGTWRDAEDGVLSSTAVAQGAVDSTIGMPVDLEANGSTTLLYWIAAGRTYDEVRQLDARTRAENASHALARTASYWYTWVNKAAEDLSDLPDEVLELYRRSLLIIRTQCDNSGAIVAANDSDIQWGHNDHYSYVWTRDAAFVCDALDRAGFPEITRRFLHFASQIIRDEGYFLHKYNPDGSPASLWHPWVRDGHPQLPIQEDETALVIWLVERHYRRTRDLDLLRSLYRKLVVQPAEFLLRFRDRDSKLPRPSFDLWEERQGIFTFTCAAVVAGLDAAAALAELFGEQDRRDRFAAGAAEIRDAMTRHLWMEDARRFSRGLVVQADGTLEIDPTVDASTLGVFHLNTFSPTSAFVEGTVEAVRERLAVQTELGGFARYENDSYHRISEETDRVPGNPWIICTLWMAEYDISRAQTVDEVQGALDAVRWARSKASRALVLPEQFDPYDGQPLSVAPLTWSHAQVVSVVRTYLDALRRLRETNVEETARNQARSRANPVDNPGAFS